MEKQQRIMSQYMTQSQVQDELGITNKIVYGLLGVVFFNIERDR